jgi:erythromycin esterase-like protein
MLCLALFLFALPASTGALSTDEELAQLVTAARHEVRDENGTLSGPGYQILLAEAGRARFMLLGESHGNRETPQLARALLADLRPAGYAAYAIETGPCSTEWFVGRAREDGRAAIATLTD